MSLQILLLVLIASEFCLELFAQLLNLRTLHHPVPDELADLYDPARHLQSQSYLASRTRASLAASATQLTALLSFWWLGGFESLDQWIRAQLSTDLGRGLAYLGTLALLRLALQIPLSLYSTFVIEERFGFNRSTFRTWLSDLIKGLILGALLGAPLLAGMLWVFEKSGQSAWIYAWSGFAGFELLLTFLAPLLILPLFNRLTPLEPGALSKSIEDYARSQGFPLAGVVMMDASKRSSKSNAFFTGFGRSRRLVLFDTLIKNHSADELTSVVAHEVGHYQCGHIPKSISISLVISLALFYGLGLVIADPLLSSCLGVTHPSTYVSLTAVGLFLGPLSRVFSVLTHALSRRHEFEADAFAVRTYGKPKSLISALKGLSRDNLSHLTPHPFTVWLDYTHPPILQRLRAISSLIPSPSPAKINP